MLPKTPVTNRIKPKIRHYITRTHVCSSRISNTTLVLLLDDIESSSCILYVTNECIEKHDSILHSQERKKTPRLSIDERKNVKKRIERFFMNA